MAALPKAAFGAFALVARDAGLAALCRRYPAAARALPWIAVAIETLPMVREILASPAPARCVGPFVLDDDMIESCVCPQCVDRRARFLGE